MARPKKEPELFEELYSDMSEDDLKTRIVNLLMERSSAEQAKKDYVDSYNETIKDLGERIDACIHWVKQKRKEEKGA